MGLPVAKQDPAICARGAAPPPALRRLVEDTRTPLNAIQGFAELLLAGAGGPLSAAALDYLGQIAEAARRLERAVQAFAAAAADDAAVGTAPVLGPCPDGGGCATRHLYPDKEG